MGGPDTLEDVEPFLLRLFSDRELIRLGPRLLQKPLARFLARRRAPKSKAIYSLIGGGSPQKTITYAQAAALEKLLRQEGNFKVKVAMRYWSPTTEEALEELLSAGIGMLIGISLYPQYSKATAGSSLNCLQQAVKRRAPDLDYRQVGSWAAQPSYIQALAENVTQGLTFFSEGSTAIVYSAHSLPVSFINEGDPYVEHLHQTIAALEQHTALKGFLCYQSRSGPVRWLSPSTSEMLEGLATKGYKNILMIPISFVSDHIETLYEIDILYREKAKQLGMQLRSCPSLNTSDLFIQALKEIVQDQMNR